MKKRSIYFDNNATTPLLESVIKKMLFAHKELFGNPSSVTKPGRKSKNYLNDSRKKIASFLGCESSEITFTSGGTESINSLITGLSKGRSGKIISTKIEHKCILETLKQMPNEKHFLDVDACGKIDLCSLKEALETKTSVVVLSLVNSEIGTILALKEVAEITSHFDVPLIIDGVAALGKMPLQLYDGVTAMAFSAHKIHGPKGAGFFYLKKDSTFSPSLFGGMQESQKRAGTENVAGILGMTEAIEQISNEDMVFIKDLRDTFEKGILEIFPSAQINGDHHRACNISNVYFKDFDGDHLLIYLDNQGISVSLGSACTSGSLEPSHVLIGCGFSPKKAASCLRFSFSKLNTVEEVHETLCVMKEYVKTFALA